MDSEELDGRLRRALVGGLRPVVPQLTSWDPSWPQRFEAHRRRIDDALGPRALCIEHIGSTAVPGLAAKDVVDVLVGVADPDDEPAYLPALLGVGYEVRVVEPGHRMLRASEGLASPANVHFYAPHCVEVEKYRLLREHLRAEPEARRVYEQVKQALAGREWPDMNHYAEAKGPVVRRLLREAGWTGPL